jgi:hypothetical protein
MMKLGEAADRLFKLAVLDPEGVAWALAVCRCGSKAFYLSLRCGTITAYQAFYAALMTWPNWRESSVMPPIPGPLSGGAAALACSSVSKTWTERP